MYQFVHRSTSSPHSFAFFISSGSLPLTASPMGHGLCTYGLTVTASPLLLTTL
jgi:hypothetical protein